MNLYVIHSLKWSDNPNYEGDIVYWGPNDSGYTSDINKAGIYTEEQVNGRRNYYDNGDTTKAIKLDVTKFDENTVARMELHYQTKINDEIEINEAIEKAIAHLECLKNAKYAIKKNIESQKFKLNQQLLLHGKELM